MDFFGIKINEELNREMNGKLCNISAEGSRVQVWILPTNEELLIARDTLELISKINSTTYIYQNKFYNTNLTDNTLCFCWEYYFMKLADRSYKALSFSEGK